MEIETKMELDPSDLWNAVEGDVHSAIEYAVDSAIGDLDLSDQIAEGIDDYDFRDSLEDAVHELLEGTKVDDIEKRHARLQNQVDALQRSVVTIIDTLQKHFEQERDALKQKLSGF